MKIIILSAATGGGHLRAARAVQKYIQENEPGSEVCVIDALKSVGEFLDRTCCDGYRFLATRAPRVFGKLYRVTNRPGTLHRVMRLFTSAFSLRLLPVLDAEKPDIVISTHPFATEMVSYLKERRGFLAPLLCIMTDYGPHRAWIANQVDAYVVSSEDMLPELAALGVPPEKVYPFGIPVDGVFFSRADKRALLLRFGLNPASPAVLLMAGSFGVNNILAIYREICKLPLDFQVMVITGRSKKLYAAFAELLPRSLKRTHLVFYTDEVEDYMHASDLIITKPGGLTVSEALACGIPLAVFDAIPGQEEDNADFLLAHNMAIRLTGAQSCGYALSALLGDRRRLETMRSSCAGFDKSRSAENIFALMRELVMPPAKENSKAAPKWRDTERYETGS